MTRIDYYAMPNPARRAWVSTVIIKKSLCVRASYLDAVVIVRRSLIEHSGSFHAYFSWQAQTCFWRDPQPEQRVARVRSMITREASKCPQSYLPE